MSQDQKVKTTSVTTVNPANGEDIHTYQFQNAASLTASLDRAAKGFKVWRDTSAADRAALLARLAKVFREQADDLANLITLEMGKTLKQAHGEIEKCAVLAEWYAVNGPRLIADEPTTVEDEKA